MSMEELYDGFNGLYDELDRLRAVNKDLLEALTGLVTASIRANTASSSEDTKFLLAPAFDFSVAVEKARAAIAKAEGRT